MDEDEKIVVLTKHGCKRVKQRAGINKKGALRISERAYNIGLKGTSIPGRLGKYVIYKKQLNCSKNAIYRVYGEYIYVFVEDRYIAYLVTIIPIPTEYKKYKKRYKKHKEERYAKNCKKRAGKHQEI